MHDALELNRIARAQVGEVPVAHGRYDEVAEGVERAAGARDADETAHEVPLDANGEPIFDPDALPDLMERAWRLVAPASLVKKYDSADR